MDRHRLQVVRHGGREGGLAVQHDSQTLAVGAVHGVEDLIGVDLDIGRRLDPCVLPYVGGADRADLDQVRGAEIGEVLRIHVGRHKTASLRLTKRLESQAVRRPFSPS